MAFHPRRSSQEIWPDRQIRAQRPVSSPVTHSHHRLLTAIRGFATAESYQDMHGQVKAGKQTFLKSEFYKAGPDNTLMGIVAQRDPVKHRETRKSLSHAFSAKALRLQTDVVLKYVDMWVGQVKRLGNTEEGINTEEVGHNNLCPRAQIDEVVLQLAYIRHNRRSRIWGTIRRCGEGRKSSLGHDNPERSL
jgi:cytochrome P450